MIARTKAVGYRSGGGKSAFRKKAKIEKGGMAGGYNGPQGRIKSANLLNSGKNYRV